MKPFLGFVILFLAGGNITVARAVDPPQVNLRRTVAVEVAAKTKGAVVNVSTTKLVEQRVGPLAGNPFFQDFGSEIAKVPARSLGSGFLVHEDGYVVTNNHVVDQARTIQVELEDGRKLDANLISTDPDHDLAVLKIDDRRPFPTVALGDSADLLIGEPAIAIGNPLGYSHSVSEGIVSALHRDLKDAGDNDALSNLIQTDAAINPGNSGGPLLNAYGQVIGINTAVRNGAQNIGFAIPVDRLRELIPELLNPSVVSKTDVKLRLRERRTLTEPATVTAVVETDEPRPHTVTAIDGRRPRDIVDAYVMLLKLQPGQAFTVDETLAQSAAAGSATRPAGAAPANEAAPPDVTIEPGAARLSPPAMSAVSEITSRRTLRAEAVPLPDAVVQAKRVLGITVEPMSPMLAEKYQLQADRGLLVVEVARDGPAASAGVQPGDVIVRLGRFPVATLADLSSLLGRFPAHGQVRIALVRGNEVGLWTLSF